MDISFKVYMTNAIFALMSLLVIKISPDNVSGNYKCIVAFILLCSFAGCVIGALMAIWY